MNPRQKKKMLEVIEKEGCLLVYPINNAKNPKSLWYALYPRSEMTWDWSEDGDQRVADLWHSREVLSRSKDVVYSKWYKGRATFFSKKIYILLLSFLGTSRGEIRIPRPSLEVLNSLQMDSPQSTKVLKESMQWQGRLMEGHYNKAMKPLWENLYIVGFGESYDTSFPSLNMAASETLFEECWLESRELSPADAQKELYLYLGAESPFIDFAEKLRKKYRSTSDS